MTASLGDRKLEQRALKALMLDEYRDYALRLTEDYFSFVENRQLFSLIKKFVQKYNVSPDKEALYSFVDEQSVDEDIVANYGNALRNISKLPKIKGNTADSYFDSLSNLMHGRELFEHLTSFNEEVSSIGNSKSVKYLDLKNDFIRRLSKTTDELSLDAKPIRGYVYDRELVEDRWKQFIKKTRGDSEDVVPYGMAGVDDAIGGMLKGTLNLVYSKTGGGKSMFMMNVGLNAASEGRHVLYVSLEMKHNDFAARIDSNHGEIDSYDIIFGRANQETTLEYKKLLEQRAGSDFPFYISDVPLNTTPQTVENEINEYLKLNKVKPDLVIVDYGNIMSPDHRKPKDRSSFFDLLFQQLKQCARKNNVALLTAVQESRDASKEDIKGFKNKHEEEDKAGVHNIGASNYIAVHCETILRLKQDASDAIQNRINVFFDKGRFGTKVNRTELRSYFDIGYIGEAKKRDSTRVAVLG